jgi:hypothetical protein
MNAEKKFSLERYRVEVWEGQLVTNWTIGEGKRKPTEISPGDMIILSFVKSGTPSPGIYGWGIITSFYKEDEDIDFRPTSPSDYLKMNPVPENEVSGIIDKIRGRMTQLTMFKVDEKEFKELRQKIAGHVYGITP